MQLKLYFQEHDERMAAAINGLRMSKSVERTKRMFECARWMYHPSAENFAARGRGAFLSESVVGGRSGAFCWRNCVAISVSKGYLKRIQFVPRTYWKIIRIFNWKDDDTHRFRPYEIRIRWCDVGGERSLFGFGAAGIKPFQQLADCQNRKAGQLLLQEYQDGWPREHKTATSGIDNASPYSGSPSALMRRASTLMPSQQASQEEVERETGFEPATPTLARLCSTS